MIKLGSCGMLTSANKLSKMLFYFEIWLNVPPDFHNPSFQFLINWEAVT